MCNTCQEGRTQKNSCEKRREKVTHVFTHQALEQDILLPAGYFTPLEEMRVSYKGREVLYVVGELVAESCCCASGNCGYVLVAGYVLNWKNGIDETGRLLSSVEPVTNDEDKLGIAEIVRQREGISNIRFW